MNGAAVCVCICMCVCVCVCVRVYNICVCVCACVCVCVCTHVVVCVCTTPRFFIFVAYEDGAALDLCTKPDWLAIPAAAADAPARLRVRANVRSFRFAPLPRADVREGPTQFSWPAEGGDGVQAVPYAVAHINSMGKQHTGYWRWLTCVCAVCVAGGSSDRCVAWGAGHQPPVWWHYTAGTIPSDGWLAKYIRRQFPLQLPLPQAPVLTAEELEFFFLTPELCGFLWRVGRYAGNGAQCRKMVSTLFKAVEWVTEWLLPLFGTPAYAALAPRAKQQVRLYAQLRLEKVRWAPPRAWTPVGGERGRRYTAANFIASI